MKSGRRVIQIVPIGETIACLCDDGSMWLLRIAFDEGWKERTWMRLPDIPQGKS
jgi:hypothetical protein